MTTQSMGRGNFWTGLLLLLISVGVIIEAIHFSDMFESPGTLGPHVLPIVVAIFLASCGVILVYRGLKEKVHSSNSTEGIEKAWFRNKLFLSVASSVFIYVLALNYIGYSITTFAFLLCMGRLLQAKWWQCLALAFVLTGGIYWLFHSFLGVPLPAFSLSE